jgi:hypothetical protein
MSMAAMAIMALGFSSIDEPEAGNAHRLSLSYEEAKANEALAALSAKADAGVP